MSSMHMELVLDERSGRAVTAIPPPSLARAPARQCRTREDQYRAMQDHFRRSGGLARSQDVASLLAIRSGLNIGALARWIVEGEVIHFDWQCDTWFPLFQFAPSDMSPRAGVVRVLRELRGVLDPWETAQWFASPSSALGHRTPADAMELDAEMVFDAARCHRYVVDG